MNGIHDLGGKHGFGPIDIDPQEPIFRAEWEARMFAMFILTFAGGFFIVDKFRHVVENMDPVHYLTSPYYEHWQHALEHFAQEHGVLTKDEIDVRVAKLKKELV
ncbi:SH3-like domain-containing protein [Aminobacter sp. MSH1]|uniref:SH3-like domain-containing protein n=1 Tax=Aminobacter sp. MSH1 TaxID=374606 RepID=UPI0021107F23|nr:SH3-like domain-containing protein [Aminobacter sp. MSH1]